jgi:RNA polymerase sigma-70 factor (ECF subfamily)
VSTHDPSPASDPRNPKQCTDAELLRRIQTGDQHAFDVLYLRHATALWGFAYSLVHSDADAEEIVHDVFLAIWGRHETWEVSTGVIPYLFRAVRNRATNYLRHRRVVNRVAADTVWQAHPPGMSDAAAQIDDVVAANDLEAIVRRIIAALPERRRMALTLRLEYQMPFAEIGEIMQISEKAAHALFTRARESLIPLLTLFDRTP